MVVDLAVDRGEFLELSNRQQAVNSLPHNLAVGS
jgi:hypothetical protein